MWTPTSALVLMLLLHPASADHRGAYAAAPTLIVTAAADDQGRSPDRPLTRLFPNLAHDVVALPSRQTVLLLLAGTAGAAAASTNDGSADLWAEQRGRSSLSRFGAAAGDGWVQGSVALGTYLIGAVADKPAVTHLGSDLLRAHFLNGLVTHGLKYAVDRARPSGGSGSFPSGHTSAAFTTAGVLQGHYGWKAGGPALALATIVGWSRVRERAHWASDIVGGATLGTIVGLTVTNGHRRTQWTVAPTPVAGGLGFVVVRNARRP
jgi:membrane-associated phospholipid phosphatase